eukprot:3646796-Rhodomonas_salina.2
MGLARPTAVQAAGIPVSTTCRIKRICSATVPRLWSFAFDSAACMGLRVAAYLWPTRSFTSSCKY